jgi:hypothetical protein
MGLGETIIALGCAIVIVAANMIDELNRCPNLGGCPGIHKNHISNRGVTGPMPLPLLSC